MAKLAVGFAVVAFLVVALLLADYVVTNLARSITDVLP